MSTLTLSDVMAADPGAVQRAALAWSALAERLDNAYEQHLVGQNRVARHGSGRSHATALQRVTKQGNELSATCQPARRIGEALNHHADVLSTLRSELDRALAAARSSGLIVDDRTGAVTIPPGLDPRLVVADESVREVAASVRSTTMSVLRRAAALDLRTTGVITTNVPAVESGFGRKPTSGRVDLARAALDAKTPAQIHDWWQHLTPQQQEWLLAHHPRVVGALDGVPAQDRDRANRAVLAELLRADGAHPGLINVRDTLNGLEHGYLLGIDASGDGKAIIAVNNPDQAAHTAVFVPGANVTMTSVGGDMTRMLRIERESDALTAQPDDVSVVYWLGYDPPSILGAADEGPSRNGAAALAPFVDGLRASHADAGANHLTVVGHSYGSTVVAEAAIQGGFHVDDIIVAGSPGMHADHVSALHIDPHHVWAGVGTSDDVHEWLAPLAHGKEPTRPSFGANRFKVSAPEHGDYWNEGTESLSNQAHIITGQYDQVTLFHGAPPAF